MWIAATTARSTKNYFREIALLVSRALHDFDAESVKEAEVKTNPLQSRQFH
jgi:hypothetical protein